MTTETNPESAAKEAVDRTRVPWLLSSRVGLALIGFFGFVNLYALRVNMSVAIVCMINYTALAEMGNQDNDSSPVEADDNCVSYVSNSTKADGEFEWDKEKQGVILGAFFWGYLITQIPGGWLAERFGGKRIFGYFMLVTAIATLLTPIGSRGSPYLLMTLRFVKGLGQGVVFPACHSLWSKWAPPLERSKLIGFTYAGAQIGNVITLPVSGLLCDYGFDGGWPSIFYILGALGVVWFIAWMLLVSDSPGQHPRISQEERSYIEESLGDAQLRDKMRKEMGTPWLTIAKSRAVWAIIMAHTCSNWGTYTLLTNIPAYMKEVLRFDIKSNGLFSAIPYVLFWIFINLGGFIADTLRSRGYQTKIVRKIMLSLGTILPGIFLIATGYITCDKQYVAVAVLSLAVGFSGFQYAGCMVNHVDIAPPFAGILFGVSNTFATLPGILAPYAIGRITAHQSQAEWQIVFYIAAAIYAVGAIFFNIFAEGEIQDWARPYMFDEETPVPADKLKGIEKDDVIADDVITDKPSEKENNVATENDATKL